MACSSLCTWWLNLPVFDFSNLYSQYKSIIHWLSIFAFSEPHIQFIVISSGNYMEMQMENGLLRGFPICA